METKEGGRRARASKGINLFIKIKIGLTAPSTRHFLGPSCVLRQQTPDISGKLDWASEPATTT